MAMTAFEEAMKNKQKFAVFDTEGNEYRGFWSDIRVDRDTLPEGWNAYDIREKDDQEDEWMGTIEENYVFVNHAGTFLTKETLPLTEREGGRKYECFGGDSRKGEWDYSFS